MVKIIYSSKFLNHKTPNGHPENCNRLIACKKAIDNSKYANQLSWIEPRFASDNELELIHNKNYINYVKSICQSGGGYLDSDTPVSQDSFNVASKSAGAWLDGIDQVLKGSSAFILSRPPGHHAEPNKGMGFCIFSNAALAAIYALKKNQINKIAIFDWDVHHGNGTQKIVESNPNIIYTSIHQFPFYPGTGSQMEKGKFNNVLNIPILSGCKSNEYKKLFNNHIFPFIYKFSPDIIIISAGFDAHKLDPLAEINLSEKDFAYMTYRLLEIQPNLLLGLEGGYSLKALTKSCVSVINELIKKRSY